MAKIRVKVLHSREGDGSVSVMVDGVEKKLYMGEEAELEVKEGLVIGAELPPRQVIKHELVTKPVAPVVAKPAALAPVAKPTQALVVAQSLPQPQPGASAPIAGSTPAEPGPIQATPTA